MSSGAISLIVFGLVFGGALVGMLLRPSLPNDHLIADSKETVQLGIGLVSTMSALVLGLLVSSTKSFYDTQNAELNQMSADVVAVDRLLDHYGPETKEAREALRVTVSNMIDRIWTADRKRTTGAPVSERSAEVLIDEIQELSAKDDKQHSLQDQALSMVVGIGRIRWLMYD